MEVPSGSSRSTSREDRRLALTERFWDFLAMVLLGKMWEVRCVFTLVSPYLARQSVAANPLLGGVLPRNLQDSSGSGAQTRVFPRSKGTPTLKSVVLGETWGNR